MILVTTTPSVDGYTITNYQGIVFGEVVSGVNMFKDLGAGLRNVVGVDIDYEVLGADNGMLMVTASGTAVQIARTA